MDRTLIVAPSWVGDSILAEPLISLLRETYEEPSIDVLAPPWCAPVFQRMRGVRRIIENPIPHGRFDLRTRDGQPLDPAATFVKKLPVTSA